MKILAIAALGLLSACATCKEHETVCAVGAVVLTGTVVAIAASHNGGYQQPAPYRVARDK